VLSLCGVLVSLGKGRGLGRPAFVAAALAAVISILTIPLWEAPSVAAGYPWSQYAQAITPVLLGVVFGLSQSRVQRGVLVGIVALLAAAVILPQDGVALPHAIALTALMVAMDHPLPWLERRNIQWLSSCMLGVYLVHPIFIGVAKRLVPEPVAVQVILRIRPVADRNAAVSQDGGDRQGAVGGTLGKREAASGVRGFCWGLESDGARSGVMQPTEV